MTGKELLERWSEAGHLRPEVGYEDIVGMPGTLVVIQFPTLAVFSIPVEDGAVRIAATIQLEHDCVQAIASARMVFIGHEDMRASIRQRASDLMSEGRGAKAAELQELSGPLDDRSLHGLYNEVLFTQKWRSQQ